MAGGGGVFGGALSLGWVGRGVSWFFFSSSTCVRSGRLGVLLLVMVAVFGLPLVVCYGVRGVSVGGGFLLLRVVGGGEMFCFQGDVFGVSSFLSACCFSIL